MDLATLIPLALKTSIVLVVFGLGLTANFRDATSLFRKPEQLLRSLLSMNVVMPLFALSLAGAFALHPAVKIALVALAVSPVPPFLPKKELKAVGSASSTIGLLVATAVLAIIFVPLAMALLARAFAIPLYLSPAAVARLVLSTVLAPLAAGIALRHVAPALAERMMKPVAFVATVLLVVSVLPVLFTAGPAIVSLIGNGTLIALAIFTLAGLTAGHVLGGPEPSDRAVLALSTASRHPGVAAAIASANFPGQKLVLPVILLYLLVSAVVTAPYLTWIRRHYPGIKAKVAMILGLLAGGLFGWRPAMVQAQTPATIPWTSVAPRDHERRHQVHRVPAAARQLGRSPARSPRRGGSQGSELERADLRCVLAHRPDRGR